MLKKKLLTAVIIIIMLFGYSSAAFCETGSPDPSAPPQLKSELAILVDTKTGKILFDKDAHKKSYPASLTKILTALLMLENLDMKETITVGREIDLVELDASEAGLVKGEKLTGSDLMWALMLPSGNDAAYTAAVYIARKKTGNPSMGIPEAVKYFADMMNKRAQELGAKESNFVNPDGYPDENHYSTAYDIALIAAAAVKNDFFRQVTGTYFYEMTGSGVEKDIKKGKNDVTDWYNKNQLINKKSKYFYEFAKGIKTGHTSLAGYCLAALAEKEDRTFISVILKADTEAARWLDSKALLEYGFNNYKYHTFIKKGENVTSVSIARKYFGNSIDINVLAAADYTDILTDKEISDVKQTFEWDKKLLLPGDNSTEVKLVGPVSSGQVVGKVSYTLNGVVLSETNLVAAHDALKGDFTDKLNGIWDYVIYHKIIVLVFVIVIAFLIIAAIILRRRAVRASK